SSKRGTTGKTFPHRETKGAFPSRKARCLGWTRGPWGRRLKVLLSLVLRRAEPISPRADRALRPRGDRLRRRLAARLGLRFLIQQRLLDRHEAVAVAVHLLEVGHRSAGRLPLVQADLAVLV